MCRSCYRGHRYCSNACRQAARTDSLRRARARYQATQEGRDGHRERQNEYRHSAEKNVTDQTPPPAAARERVTAHASEKPDEKPAAEAAACVLDAASSEADPSMAAVAVARCCRCGRTGQVLWRVEAGLSVLRHGRRIVPVRVAQFHEAKPQDTG